MAPERTETAALPSGIAAVDAAWGGLAPGGTYLVVGPSAARREAALALVRATAASGGLALVVSPRAPEAFEAAGLERAGPDGGDRVRVIPAPTVADLAALGDTALTLALYELAGLAREQRPALLLVEDFSAYVRFGSFERFAAAFIALTEAAAACPVTLALGLGEPANDASRRLLLFLQGETAGTLYLPVLPSGKATLTLLPGTAHGGDALTAPWATAAPEAPATAIEVSTVEDPGTTTPEPPLDDVLEAGGAADEVDPFAIVSLQSDDAPGGSDGFIGEADLTLDVPDPIGPEPPPPDDADWSPVAPVPTDDAPLPDPLAFPLGPDLLALGHFVDSRTHAAPPPPSGDGLAAGAGPVVGGDGLDGAAASVREAAYPELFAPALPPWETPAEAASEASEEEPREEPEAAFRRALGGAFAQRAEASFLALALRLPAGGPHADLLPALTHALDGALGADGALFGNLALGRLVALLPGRDADAAAGLFAAVREHLLAVAPGRAEEALRDVGALVAPNGEPFASADELMAYVLKGDA
jgi:hypothetical protein